MTLREPIDEIDAADLRELLGVAREGLTLDFKRSLGDLGRDAVKRELLADVTSFANVAGGQILYGVEEVGGEAAAISEIHLDDADALEARVQQIVDSNIEPKLSGFQIRAIPVEDGHVLVIRVPRSWNWPHGVKRGEGRLEFWTRSGVTKRRMDLHELRDAFVGSTGVLQQAEDHRAQRVRAIVEGQGRPVELLNLAAPYTILHLIPLEALARSRAHDLSVIRLDDGGPAPLGDPAHRTGRPTFDGVLTCGGVFRVDEPDLLDSYLLISRTGTMETLSSAYPRRDHQEPNRLVARWFDRHMVAEISRLLRIQAELGVAPPIWVAVSVFAVDGMELVPPQGGIEPHTAAPIDRDLLLLPPIVVESVEPFGPSDLRPALDAFWNAAGYRGSLSFDTEGNWLND